MLTGRQAESHLTTIVTVLKMELWPTSSSSRLAPRKSPSTTARYVLEPKQKTDPSVHSKARSVVSWTKNNNQFFSLVDFSSVGGCRGLDPPRSILYLPDSLGQ